MKKISEIFKNKRPVFSIELFPPKTDKGYDNLKATISEMAALAPDFFSCTYGAGGGSRDKTLDIVEFIQNTHGIPAMAHLTCVLHTKEEIRAIVSGMKSRGVANILALRGDPPQDNPGWTPGPGNFRYSSELAADIRRQFSDHFSIGVAGFPEGHLLCPDREKDCDYLKMKIDAGADFVITQLFFDNNDYYAYVDRLRKRNVQVPVVPGILPVTDYGALQRFASLCGATITREIKDIFEPISENKEAMLKAGCEFAIKQGRDLLKNGAPGLHFYSLNKLEPAKTIITDTRNQSS